MDKEFKKSQDLWIEGQKLLIEELKLKQEFMIKNIENQKQVLLKNSHLKQVKTQS